MSAQGFKLSAKELSLLQNYSILSHVNEIEIRFGLFDDRQKFTPGVDIACFKSILKHLSSQSQYVLIKETELLKVFYSQESLILDGRANIQNYVKQANNSVSCDWSNVFRQKKTKVKSIDNNDYAFRISVASEENIELKAEARLKLLSQISKQEKTYRYMKRYSFKTNDDLIRFDLSIVKSSFRPTKSISASDLFTQRPNYEIELEYIGDLGHIDSKRYEEEILVALKYIQSTDYPLAKSVRQDLLKDYISQFHKNKKPFGNIYSNPFRYFLGAMPVSLTLSNVIPLDIAKDILNIRRGHPDDFAVTEKADGDRQLLFVSSSSDVFLISRQMVFTYTGLQSQRHHTLIDGEWISESHRFLAFDMLFIDGRDIRFLPLLRSRDQDSPLGRIDRLDRLLSNSMSFSPQDPSLPYLKLAAKKHWSASDILEKAAEMWRERIDLFKYNIDGIFFTSRASKYPNVEKGSSTWKNCFKWKPRAFLSIDFQIFVKGDIRFHLKEGKSQTDSVMTPYRVGHLFVQDPSYRFQVGTDSKASTPRTVAFSPTKADVRQIDAHIARIWTDEQHRMFAVDPISGQKAFFKDGDIVEVVYDSTEEAGYEWKPIRIRSDKTIPNSFRTADQVWNIIHEANGLITEDSFFDLMKNKATDQILRDEYKKQSRSYYAIQESREERRSSPIFDLRQFHNDIKRRLYLASSRLLMAREQTAQNLIESAVDFSVPSLLDLGCGRGGDYYKYRDASIQRVYGVDIDKAGLLRLSTEFHEKLRRANKNPKLVVTFQASMSKLLSSGSAGITQSDKKNLIDFYKRNGTGFFPLISCQFAMHYSFSDEVSLRGLMMNIYENLQPDGYFIATSFDGQSIFDLLSQKPEVVFHNSASEFGSIRKKYKDIALKNFGQSIDVKFHSISSEFIPEFLVNFSYFRRIMAEDYGIELVTDEEAISVGFANASDSFATLFDKKHPMSSGEMSWSKLYRYMIMKKAGNGNAAVLQKWLKILSK